MPARNVKGRLVYWKISQSQQLAKVSVWAKLLFTWFIPNVDNLGRADANPHIVKGTIFPLDQEITPERCKELIKELHDAGLIILYSVKGLDYFCIPKITSYQKLAGNMTEFSDYPCPKDEDVISWEQRFSEVYTGTYKCEPDKHDVSYKGQGKSKVEGKSQSQGKEYTTSVEKFFSSIDPKWFKTLQAAYPKVNLTTEFEKMKAWLVSNPEKAKKNIKRFAVNWLSRNKPESSSGSAPAKFMITDQLLETRLGKIATKPMIKKLMQEIPQTLWWKVDQYLRKRYPGSNGSSFAEAERELVAEVREGKDHLARLTIGIGKTV
ncbi:MAG: hypothetical protein ACYDFR_03235 [Candidatus Omnitrophota bacterium]